MDDRAQAGRAVPVIVGEGAGVGSAVGQGARRAGARRWRRVSTSGRTGCGYGCRAPRWTGGSARIVRAGSTRWSRHRGGSRPDAGARVGDGVSRCGGSSPRGRRRRSTGSSWRRRGGHRRRARCSAISRRQGCHGGAAPAARATGRFEAEGRNELWTGDALHGPLIDGRKTFLFAFIDDHSRLLAGYRWATREDVLNASRALRLGIAARGLPEAVYVDNGSPFVSGQLLRACARLGIRLIHSRPGRPEGRGKIERFFRTVREQFLRRGCSIIRRRAWRSSTGSFTAWVESVYHRAASFGDRAAAT